MNISSLITEIEQFEGTEPILAWYRDKSQSKEIVSIETLTSRVNTAVAVNVSRELSAIEQHYLIALAVLACKVILKKDDNTGSYFMTAYPFGTIEEMGKTDLHYFLQSMLLSVITKYSEAYEEGKKQEYERSLRERVNSWNYYMAEEGENGG